MVTVEVWSDESSTNLDQLPLDFLWLFLAQFLCLGFPHLPQCMEGDVVEVEVSEKLNTDKALESQDFIGIDFFPYFFKRPLNP